MSFEHRVIGGDGADDEFGPDRDKSAEHKADSGDSARLHDVESVESLDDLDVLADQMRDDASYLHRQFPADQQQLLKFAEQFRSNEEGLPGLRQHVDDEMLECLRRIEALDIAERRTTRQRFVRMLAMCAGASALVVVITVAIDQYWPHARVHVAQQHAGATSVFSESAARDSAVFAMSAAYGVNEPVELNSVTIPTEVDVDALTASSEHVSHGGVLSVDGDIVEGVIEPVDLQTKTTPQYTLPGNSSFVDTSDVTQTESRDAATAGSSMAKGATATGGKNMVPRLLARQGLITDQRAIEFAESKDVKDFFADDVAMPVAAESYSFPLPTFVPKGKLAAISGAHQGSTATRMGLMPSAYGPSLGATPAFDDVPEIYRSASQPEMEAIIDLYQIEQDGSITIEF